MDEPVSFREAATWTISGLAAIVSAFGARLWSEQGDRIRKNEQRVELLEGSLKEHTTTDAAAHDSIRKDLNASLERLGDRIDDHTKHISNQILDLVKYIQHGSK
jgi:uncharacterized protein YeeX (DUF496 family)